MNFVTFATAIGRCSVAWTERGIARIRLPPAPEAPGSDAPPPDVLRAIEAMQRLLSGVREDLGFVALDLEGAPPFHRRIYEIVRSIPPGETMTYGEVARRAGASGSARAVGQAMGKNPCPIVVPCHRVLAAGTLGGFSAPGGVSTKLRMLEIERAKDGLTLELFPAGPERGPADHRR
jgi:methylated-DNA-[protein]-cysteine S-methyltransferase